MITIAWAASGDLLLEVEAEGVDPEPRVLHVKRLLAEHPGVAVPRFRQRLLDEGGKGSEGSTTERPNRIWDGSNLS